MEVDLSSILPMQAQISKPDCTALQVTTMERHLRLVLLLYWNSPSTLKAVLTWKWSLWKIKVAIFIIMSLNTTNWCICCSLEPSITHSKRYLFNLFISNLVNFCFGRLDRQSVGRSISPFVRSVGRLFGRSLVLSVGGLFDQSVGQ